MNTLVNIVLSFVVFLVSSLFAFVNAFKIPLAVGGAVLFVILSFPAGAHASDLIMYCGGYGNIPLAECEGLREAIKTDRKVGLVLFVLIWVILVPALLWSDYKEKKAYRNKYKS